MVVKTETCFFSEVRIYPGHGSRLVRRDGRLLTFASHKSVAHFINRKRAQNLRWTQAWRRNHKKVAADRQTAKKLVKKTTKVFKTFVGLTLEDLKERKSADYKAAQTQAAERTTKKEVKKSEPKAQKVQVPKFVNRITHQRK